MGFSKNTQATRSTLMSVDSTLSENITAAQDYIPIASTTNFSTSVVAEIETTNEVVSFTDISANNFQYSQDLNNAYWNTVNTSVTANAGVAPDGTTTADKFIPDNLATTSYLFRHNAWHSPTYYPSIGTYIFSGYYKADGETDLRISQSDGLTFEATTIIDLSDGTITSDSHAFNAATVTSVGSGWYRITQKYDFTGLSGQSQVARNSSFTGDGTAGILIWGFQFESGSTASTYLPTTSAALVGLTGVTRGANGTTAATATSGDAIQQLPYALSDLNMPTRLKAISVSSDGTGAGRFTLCDKIGTTLLDIDLPDTSLYELDFGDDRGIVFPNGIYVANSDNITAYTLFTDKHSGAGL